jgi:hypothetical protein
MKVKALITALLFSSIVPLTAHAEGMNLRFSPIGLLASAILVNYDVAVNSNWTLGPEVIYMNFNIDSSGTYSSEINIKALGLGARGNWFKNGVYTAGLYVGPSLRYLSVKGEENFSDGSGQSTASASGLLASGLVGYGWFWDSFNIMLGGGLSLPLGDLKVETTDSNGVKTEEDISNGGGLALEFSLGWTF